MIFYFLITIVFIAELIIAFAVLINLAKLDRTFNDFNLFIEDAKPSIKELMVTVRKLSEQLSEFAPIVVKEVKSAIKNILLGHLKNLIGALTFWLVKKEVEKHV